MEDFKNFKIVCYIKTNPNLSLPKFLLCSFKKTVMAIIYIVIKLKCRDLHRMLFHGQI